MENLITKLTELAARFGDSKADIFAGGSVSCKESGALYVSNKRVCPCAITSDGFTKMDQAVLEAVLEKEYAENGTRVDDIKAACLSGEMNCCGMKALLHASVDKKYVLHLQSNLVNAFACGNDAREMTVALFPEADWISEGGYGYKMALGCKGSDANIIFVANNGAVVSADTVEELDQLLTGIKELLTAQASSVPATADESPADMAAAVRLAPAIRMLYADANSLSTAIAKYVGGNDLLSIDPQIYGATPEYVRILGSKRLVFDAVPEDGELSAAYAEFTAENGAPKVVCVKGVGAFVCAPTLKEAQKLEEALLREAKIAVLAKAFGGFSPVDDEVLAFVSARKACCCGCKDGAPKGRLAGKVAVITGAAQGFGLGIAESMAAEGAYVVIADMNAEGAAAAAAKFDGALSSAVNVTEEESVERMVNDTVLYYGGIDVFVNNAGIVRAGSLEEMTKRNFELVTSVNYTAYFICTKYAVAPMKIQHKFSPNRYFDVIEINSKSGLAGSNKNFAYAGSKFGGLGLTQSFALELAPYNIKVNAICPGNFLDGPLWSDPEKGLFVQYLNSGKVPGAKTIEDVRRFYEAKVPLNRGCRTIDVARAVFYIMEQEYETGQAIPVTGGQEMLN